MTTIIPGGALRRALFLCMAFGLVLWPAAATQEQETGTTTPAVSKGAASSKGTSTAGKKTVTPSTKAKATAGTSTAAKSKKKGPQKKTAPKQDTWRSRQMQPTPERYKEIQDALIRKGYLSGSASGTWDQASIDALRRFQTDQNLEASGKIDSLSLIALGLGPTYATPVGK